MHLSDRQWDNLSALLEGRKSELESDVLNSLATKGLVKLTANSWKLTPKGHRALATIIHA